MYLISRSAFRTVTSPSTSFLAKSRSITTFSPFIARTKPQATLSPLFRRFASHDVESEGRESETETESTPSSTDQSSIASSVSSAAETASSYASAAKDAVVDTASGVAEAAGLAYAPREDRREYRPRRDDRRSAPYPGRNGGMGRGSFIEPRVIAPSNTIYVGNMLFECTEADIQRDFIEFGEIVDIRIAKDDRNLSKGFCHITYDSVDSATAAIRAMNQTTLNGRRIVANYQTGTSRPLAENPPSKTLFIGNLAFEMSDADLNKLFQNIKNVLDVRVAIDRRTGQPRGFAHADFADVESAEACREQLGGKEVYGRSLRIDFAADRRYPEAGNEAQAPRSRY